MGYSCNFTSIQLKRKSIFFVCFWLIIPDDGKRVRVYRLEKQMYFLAFFICGESIEAFD